MTSLAGLHVPIYMIKTKVAFFGGPAFFSQSRLFENFSDCSDWMDRIKAGPPKSHFCFDHVNWLIITSFGAGFLSRLSSSQSFFI